MKISLVVMLVSLAPAAISVYHRLKMGFRSGGRIEIITGRLIEIRLKHRMKAHIYISIALIIAFVAAFLQYRGY